MTTLKINGRVASKEEWVNSTEDGIHQAYYPNEQIESEYNYQNNKTHGLCRRWYSTGQLKYEWNYQNGKLHGLCRSWEDDGSLLEEAIFVNHIDRIEEFKDNKLAQVVVFGKVIL